MRMRKKKNLEPRLEKCASILISQPESLKGAWRDRFKMQGQLHLEIGCGKGQFITQTALQNPDKMFVAIERVPDVLILALEKALELNVANLLFISIDAANLGDVFSQDEVDTVYLNFSDPWPPSNRAKRRLSHHNFLSVYDGFLKPGGSICMKTDNPRLFEFSLCEFSQFGYALHNITLDLHKTDTPNIMTEYEQRFCEMGMNIHRCVAVKPLLKTDNCPPAVM